MGFKTSDKVNELARDMVDSWDNKCLYQFAVDMVADHLENCDEEVFRAEWDNHYLDDAEWDKEYEEN